MRLSARRSRFDETLGGVMLAYWNEKPLTTTARAWKRFHMSGWTQQAGSAGAHARHCALRLHPGQGARIVVQAAARRSAGCVGTQTLRRLLSSRRPVGRVNMVGADHIGLLVFNMFNVSVARESMRSELAFVDTARRCCRRCRHLRAPTHTLTATRRRLGGKTGHGW